MPTKKEIINEVCSIVPTEIVRTKYLNQLHEYTKNDILLYCSAYMCFGTIRTSFTGLMDEDLQNIICSMKGLKADTLDFIIHTPGGSLDAAQKIVHYLRGKYNKIRLIVPMAAMSAGTLLCCAADEILMTKHSFLGPIDPQIIININNKDEFVPINSIIEEFEYIKSLFNKENANYIHLLTDFLNKYPPISQLNDIRLRSSEISANWLERYMKITSENSRAIACWLSDFSKNHRCHSNPISYNEAKEKGLRVSLIEEDQLLQEKVLSLMHAAMATFEFTNCAKIIQSNGDYSSVQFTTNS